MTGIYGHALGWKFPAIVTLAALITGCSFSSSQIDAVQGLFNKPEPLAAGWIAQLGLERRLVTPVQSDELVIFASEQGDAVAFDGWTLRAVVGFGLVQPLLVRIEDTERRYGNAGDWVAHECAAWQKIQQMPNQWQQTCSAHYTYKNSISLNTENLIIQINQVVGADGTRLVLSKQ